MTPHRAGRTHHLAAGIANARKRVLALADDHQVLITDLTTGEVLCTHLIEPEKTYWRKKNSPAAGRAPQTETHDATHLRHMSRLITKRRGGNSNPRWTERPIPVSRPAPDARNPSADGMPDARGTKKGTNDRSAGAPVGTALGDRSWRPSSVASVVVPRRGLDRCRTAVRHQRSVAGEGLSTVPGDGGDRHARLSPARLPRSQAGSVGNA
jgi:hypothetical protein